MNAFCWLRTGLAVLLSVAATGWAYLAFLIACDVGLHLSARPEEYAPGAASWILAVTACAGISGALMAVASCRRIVGTATQQRTAGAIGTVTAVLIAAPTALYALLLSSSTWGDLAGSDYIERNRLVSAVGPAWHWWLLVLAAFTIARPLVGSWIRLSPRPARIMRLACAVAVPISIVGVMLTLIVQSPA